MSLDIRQPTPDEASANAKVYEDETQVGYAIWYPQMGGYVGLAVALFGKGEEGGCVNVLVWHDGEFPFGDEDEDYQPPRELHHCDPGQFINFGQTLEALDAKQHTETVPTEPGAQE